MADLGRCVDIWADDSGEGQLVQLGDFHSLGRLDNALVGLIAELVQGWGTLLSECSAETCQAYAAAA